MKITVENIVNTIKTIFDDTKLSSIETIYEKIDNSTDLKLILFFHNVFYDKTNIIYTKLIFTVNNNKTVIENNSFMYLYDINCEYKKVEFDSIENFKSKIRNVFDNRKFGKQIIALSDFIKNPTTLINKWLSDNDVVDKSLIGFKYEPKITIMPCKSLFFNFDMNLNDKFDLNLIILKENSGQYDLIFKINGKEHDIKINSLNQLVQEIGSFIKHKI